MAFKGMNPEEGREVAKAVSDTGEHILDVIDPLTQLVNSVEWVGPDYEAYTQDWNAFVSGPLNNLLEAFRTKGEELNTHAEEQDTTSNQQ